MTVEFDERLCQMKSFIKIKNSAGYPALFF